LDALTRSFVALLLSFYIELLFERISCDEKTHEVMCLSMARARCKEYEQRANENEREREKAKMK